MVKRYSVSENIYEGVKAGAHMVVVEASEFDRLTAALERIRRRSTGSIWAIANGALLSLPDSQSDAGGVNDR